MDEGVEQSSEQVTEKPLHPPLADAPPETVFKPVGKVSGLLYLLFSILCSFLLVLVLDKNQYGVMDYITFCCLIAGALYMLYSGLILFTFPIQIMRLTPYQFEYGTDLHVPWHSIEIAQKNPKRPRHFVIVISNYDSIEYNESKERMPLRQFIYAQTFLVVAVVIGILTKNPKWFRYRKLFRENSVIPMLKLNRELTGYDIEMYEWQIGGNIDRFDLLCQSCIDHSRKEQLPTPE